MNRKTAVSVLLSCLAIYLCPVSPSQADALKVGYRAGNLKFAEPISEADQRYLGLEKPGGFSRADVKAPYVLVEVLNANCPHCVEQAPGLNKLYNMVANSALKDKLKFIGVVSNPAPAAKRWKTAFQVPFPLVADPDWNIAEALNITGTPTTVVLDRDGKVVYLEDGAFPNAARVFNALKSRLQ
jgi:peroxiredoxin